MSAGDLRAPSQGGDLFGWIQRQMAHSQSKPDSFHRGIVEALLEVQAGLVPLVAERDALRARVAELEAAQRWIPVSERLPANGVKVEGFDEVHGHFIGRFGLRGWRGEHDVLGAFRTFDRVTHWRQLGADPEVSP